MDKNMSDVQQEVLKQPDEQGTINIRGHIKITDVTDADNHVVIRDKFNAIHYENISEAIAYSLANKGQSYIYEMRFGNGGTSVDPTGVINYLPTNTNQQNADLYNPTYSKIVDDTAAAKMKIMAACGIHVCASPADIGKTMAAALKK